MITPLDCIGVENLTLHGTVPAAVDPGAPFVQLLSVKIAGRGYCVVLLVSDGIGTVVAFDELDQARACFDQVSHMRVDYRSPNNLKALGYGAVDEGLESVHQLVNPNYEVT